MARVWLPITDPVRKKPTLLYIPGAASMDRSELEEIILWQAEREVTQAKLEAQREAAKPVATMSRKEVGKALNEFIKWRNAKREDPGYKKVF